MGLLGLDMGKVTLVRKKSVGSAFFLKLVRPLVFRDPASAENRVVLHVLCRSHVHLSLFTWTTSLARSVLKPGAPNCDAPPLTARAKRVVMSARPTELSKNVL